MTPEYVSRSPRFKDFPWPAIVECKQNPVWTGSCFEVCSRRMKVLAFAQSESAWSPELTEMHEREASSSHPIDLASRALAVDSMKMLMVRRRPIIIDIGCSSGFLIEDLMREIPQSELIGADYILEIVLKAAQRLPNNPFLQFDLRRCPLPDACVDGITALNVLEHIDDDLRALVELHRILKRGGLAHIEVPADPRSFDLYDEVLLHFRRYRLSELTEKARKVGFVVRKATHLGFFPYPLFKYAKIRNQHLGKRLTFQEKTKVVAEQIRSTRSSRILARMFAFERRLGSVASYPFGIRAVATLEKV
jgi:ubiquinone/menaquinone biosynthesis C-methylase UbiE